MNALIEREFKTYVFQEERLKKTLERERGNLESYAQKENASAAYISRQNRFLASIWSFIEATDALLESIATARRIAAYEPVDHQRSHYEATRLKEENFKLREYLKYLGKDPDLINYMTVRDFTHY